MSDRYDFVVIGWRQRRHRIGRSGRFNTALRALVVESGRLGGTCVNVGCVPKKVMWNAAELAHRAVDAADYGLRIARDGFDWGHLKTERDAYVTRLNGIYESRLEREGIDLVRGHARLAGPGRVEVDGRTVEAEHVLLATGGAPRVPAVPGAPLGITSDGFFELESLPRRVAVVGGGYIAVELAGIFAGLGGAGVAGYPP